MPDNPSSAWTGVWETDYGRMRLVEGAEGLYGWYAAAGHSRIAGRAEGRDFAFRYEETAVNGEGRFIMAESGDAFTGTWRPAGAPEWLPWSGRRIRAEAGVQWLVVLEAHWQRSLAEPEYAFGHMVREVFARRANVRVRQRFFHDVVSLEHWCREVVYLAEPVILVIASHGSAEGLSVRGQVIDTPRVLAALEGARTLTLLHFSACLVGLDGAHAFGRTSFPVSGYTTSVDWGASALIEFTYIDLILGRGLEPREASRHLKGLVPFSGDKARRDSPYPAAGFRFFPAG